ncbi:MAG TPA: hypothetical protein VHA78_04445 [Candidatus Peribacteraceae bacterium]|nr:hypothetical protein [Candidatus Peribacteraceae bacterium]
MKTPLSVALAGVIAAGMIPAAFALTASGSSSSQGTAYISPYGTFYQNGSVASTNSSSSPSPYDYNYDHNYLYGSSSSNSPNNYQYSSASPYGTYSPAANTGGFQGLGCLGMTGQDFLSCLQQYGVMSTPGSLLIQNGSGSGLPSLACNRYTGMQFAQCQQQLTDFWRSYDASLQIWWTQLQQYIHGLMAQANINPAQVGSMTGSSVSSSVFPAQNEAAIKQYWQVCGQFDFPEQQRCMHDALTNQTRYQDWLQNLNQMRTTPNTYGSSNSYGTSNYPYLPAGTYPSGNMGGGIYNGGANLNSNTTNRNSNMTNTNGNNSNSTTTNRGITGGNSAGNGNGNAY